MVPARIAPALALLGALASMPAHAVDDISYSYVDVGYGYSDVDDFDSSGDGFATRLSGELDRWLFIAGSYARNTFDLAGAEVKVTQWDAGLGVPYSLRENLDVYGQLGYVRLEGRANVTGGGRAVANDGGLQAAAGVRWLPPFANRQLELTGRVAFLNLDDSVTAISGGARYFISETAAVVGDAEFSSDETRFFIGLRIDFGRDPY